MGKQFAVAIFACAFVWLPYESISPLKILSQFRVLHVFQAVLLLWLEKQQCLARHSWAQITGSQSGDGGRKRGWLGQPGECQP